MAPTSARCAGAAAVAGVRRRLGREGPLLDRSRLLFVLLNVLIAVLTPPDLTDPGHRRGHGRA